MIRPAVLPPGHAAIPHRAARPLVLATLQQEAGLDGAEVEVGEVCTVRVAENKIQIH